MKLTSVLLACRVTVAGDTMTVDFDGTDPTDRHAVNVPACYTQAFARYAIKCITVPGIPNNLGMLQPIDVRIPPGCILDAQRPAATGGRHTVGWFIVPLLHGALAQAVPHRVQADAGMASLFIGLVDKPEAPAAAEMIHAGTRQTLSVQYFLAGGLGGMQGLDGHATTP